MAGQPQPTNWRIDDLAHATGVTVDTIRYYQREGLLAPGEREGRHRIYGPEHVERLRRIKDLQGRRFSIAAIRALVTGDGTRLDGVFTDAGEDLRLTYEDLLERSGASAELAAALRAAEVLRDPADFGRTAYDGDDLEMLRSLVKLERLGFAPKVLAALARRYAEGIEATQRSVVDVFVTGGGLDWDPGELEALQAMAAAHASALLPSMRRLVDYTHHRTIQRLTLDAVQRGTYVDPDGVDSDLTDPGLELPTVATSA